MRNEWPAGTTLDVTKCKLYRRGFFFSESAIKLEKLTKKCHIITNLHQYLHFSSCHPSSTKRSIPYSLAIRGGIYAVTQMTTTPTPLTSPNPSSTEVIPLLSSPHKFAVPYSLMPLQPNHNSNPSPLITIYYPGLLKLKWILRESFHILSSDLSTLNFLKIPFTIPHSQWIPPQQPAARHVKSTSPPNRSPAPNRALFIPSPHLPKYSNLVYQLRRKKCKTFYIGETGQILSKHVNGHHSTFTVMKSNLPVPIHTQSLQLPFQECWSVRVIHKHPDAIPDHQYETAYQLVLKCNTFLYALYG